MSLQNDNFDADVELFFQHFFGAHTITNFLLSTDYLSTIAV